MVQKRIESDSMGTIEVDTNAYYGAQTARSLVHFSISQELIPLRVIKALATLKKSAAKANTELKKLPKELSELIIIAATEIQSGKFDKHFPLRVWQTGSGTQSNMNVNEVISNRASELAKQPLGSKTPVHPNDHVNMSQSSNDTFPTAMHIAAVEAIHDKLLPSLNMMVEHINKKRQDFAGIVKIGRTHLMDAVPLYVSDELSGYVSQLKRAKKTITHALEDLYELALGGTAVGTGLNTPKGFKEAAIAQIAKETGYPFRPADNTFAALSSHDALAQMSSCLKTLATALIKIAFDIALLGSGPRCGLHEYQLPANEPGSSIMPGKVNPTQCEAMCMAATQVIGLDTAVAIGNSRGNFQLNVYKPLIIYNVLTSIDLLSDTMTSFSHHLLHGLLLDEGRIKQYINESLMLVTALAPSIGYDKASEVAKKAFKENTTLFDIVVSENLLSKEECLKILDPHKMANPPSRTSS